MANTMSKYGSNTNRPLSEIVGLSTDTKPTDSIEGIKIQNGSSFRELDTGKRFLFDAENTTWNEVSSGGGGGGGSTLIEKSISANGVYNASSDSADGYSKVTVDVSNSYTAQDEGKVVDNGALVAQTAMTITQNGVYDTTGINSITVNIVSSAIVSRTTDFVNNISSFGGDISTHSVYTGINRCNVSDDGTINAYYGDSGYVEDGSNGQVMVKIPKFYYKVTPDSDGGLDGVNIRKCTWEISNTPANGFALHPAFYDANGNEIDYFLYGAFDGVGQRGSAYGTSYNTTSDKLSSVAGSSMLPTNSLTRATARTMATNRGTGWYSAGVKQTMAVLMLFAVEYGFNSQLAVGWGVVKDSAAHNTGQTTGNTTSGTRDNRTTSVNYRGIENLWGNIWNWIDGLNCNDTTPYVCNTFTFVDDTSTGYTQIAFNLPSTNYITAFGYDANNSWILLPSESSSTANVDGSIGDHVRSNSGWRVSQLGGNWAFDSNAGAFYWYCLNSSYTSSDNGARLMFIPSAT